MLGSSQGGVQFAIDKGLGFVFAAHLAPRIAIPMLRFYRENFKPSIYMNEPKSMLAIQLELLLQKQRKRQTIWQVQWN